jgi:hypothetical protein
MFLHEKPGEDDARKDEETFEAQGDQEATDAATFLMIGERARGTKAFG